MDKFLIPLSYKVYTVYPSTTQMLLGVSGYHYSIFKNLYQMCI